MCIFVWTIHLITGRIAARRELSTLTSPEKKSNTVLYANLSKTCSGHHLDLQQNILKNKICINVLDNDQNNITLPKKVLTNNALCFFVFFRCDPDMFLTRAIHPSWEFCSFTQSSKFADLLLVYITAPNGKKLQKCIWY